MNALKKPSIVFFSLLGWLTFPAQAQQRVAEMTHEQQFFYQPPERITLSASRHEPDGDAAGDARDPIFKAKLHKPPRVALTKANRWKNVIRTGNNAVVSIENDAPGLTTVRTMSGDLYCAAPMVPEGLESVFDGVKAYMPFYVPYRHSKVGIWQGYYYNWDNNNDGNKDMHGAIDFGRGGISAGSDPTFGVYAVAPGKVINAEWSNGGGNYVEIEHTAPNGHKYRSRYLHLRNGHDHDRNMAKNSPSDKYKKFANSNNSNLSWGSNSQLIQVKKGDMVSAGQFIAWAGNTGSGGIGVILNDDGTLTNPSTTSFNVHLHFEVRVPDTRPGKSGQWVRVDPYGVYNTSGPDCYSLEANTPYNRLFAPFYPSFHNIPLNIVNHFWGYYTGMGMALQTISVDRSGGTLYAAGSFQWGLPGAWYARFYMTGDKYQQYFTDYKAKGFRPRQISVTTDGGGHPRFSVLWEKNPSGESYYAAHNRSDQNFSTLWNEYVKTKKWHVGEHVDYTVNGKRYHAVVFVNKPNDNGFYCYYGLSSSAFNQKFKDLYNKWGLISMHVTGNTVGGLWRPKNGNYAAYFGMTAAGYQQRFEQFAKQGLRLIKVQNYSGSSRFAAIWAK